LLFSIANVFFSDGSISIVGAGATLDVTYCAYMNGTFNVSLSENLDTVQVRAFDIHSSFPVFILS